MLTADLVQARVRQRRVEPRYIDPGNVQHRALAEALIGSFKSHVGKTRRELDSELRDCLGTGTAFLLHRGFAKLLLDRSEFSTCAEVEPASLRRAVFEAAADAYRSSPTGTLEHAKVVEPVLGALGLEPATYESNLYADLKEEQILEEFKECTSEWLVHRYNVALAQAVLLRATSLSLRLQPQPQARLRQLFRKMKFCQLLYRVHGTPTQGYEIHIDGPLSLFKASQRYGLQMANFLPAVLHCEGWSLEARVLWGKQRQEQGFQLTPTAGLRPHTHATAQWTPEEIAWLGERFPKLKCDWDISMDAELVDLGGRGVLVPDYVFTHRPSGRRFFMEIFGFWRRSALEARLKLLRAHGPRDLIVALGKGLHTAEEKLEDLPADVYLFRHAPVAREVLALLEKLRTKEAQ